VSIVEFVFWIVSLLGLVVGLAWVWRSGKGYFTRGGWFRSNAVPVLLGMIVVQNLIVLAHWWFDGVVDSFMALCFIGLVLGLTLKVFERAFR